MKYRWNWLRTGSITITIRNTRKSFGRQKTCWISVWRFWRTWNWSVTGKNGPVRMECLSRLSILVGIRTTMVIRSVSKVIRVFPKWRQSWSVCVTCVISWRAGKFGWTNCAWPTSMKKVGGRPMRIWMLRFPTWERWMWADVSKRLVLVLLTSLWMNAGWRTSNSITWRPLSNWVNCFRKRRKSVSRSIMLIRRKHMIRNTIRWIRMSNWRMLSIRQKQRLRRIRSVIILKIGRLSRVFHSITCVWISRVRIRCLMIRQTLHSDIRTVLMIRKIRKRNMKRRKTIVLILPIAMCLMSSRSSHSISYWRKTTAIRAMPNNWRLMWPRLSTSRRPWCVIITK